MPGRPVQEALKSKFSLIYFQLHGTIDAKEVMNMRISRNLLILAGLAIGVCACQAEIPERNADGYPTKMPPKPREAFRVRITSRLSFGLFALSAPGASAGIPELSRDLVDPAQLKIFVNSIGYGVGFHWSF